MPVLIVSLLRMLLIAVMQTAAFVAVAGALEKLVDWLREKFKKEGGMTDQEFDDTIANEVLDALALIGVTVASLKTRLPLRLVDKLGLKGTPAKKKIASQTIAKAELASKRVGLLGSKSKQALLVALPVSFLGSLPWIPSLVSNFADQATFAPTKANDFYQAIFGIRPFPTESGLATLPPLFTEGTFADWAVALETAGASSISNVIQGRSEPYTRANLARFATESYSKHVLMGETETVAKIIKRLTPYVATRSTPSVSLSGAAATGGGTASTGSATPPVQQIKIYTGVIGGGTLGLPQEFVARSDDMIQNVNELKAAAKNNLASFVQGMPGRFWYEISIQNTIKTRGGSTIKGEAVKVIGSYTSKGTPRYKTVYHKFAVMKIGVTDENGRNARLATINLGPVNAVDFQPTASDLATIEKSITPELFTSDVAEIRQVATPEVLAAAKSSGTTDTKLVDGVEYALVATNAENDGWIVEVQSGQQVPRGATVYDADAGYYKIGNIDGTAEDYSELEPSSSALATSPVILRPTAQQVFNRLNPQPVQISVPSAGIFSDGYEQLFLQRDDGFVWQLRLETLVPPGTYKNYGEQLDAGKRILREAYGIDFAAIPTVLLGDWFADWARKQPARYPQFRYPQGVGNVLGNGVLVKATPDKFVNQRVATLLPSVLNGPIGDAASASTLAAYYAAYDSAVPSVDDRRKLYEATGLGAASTYTASAEQNNRLLGWLKAQR